MKTFVGVGALLASSLLFAADAKAGISDWFCRCPCPSEPASAPAATASVQGTTSYTATYQPAGTSERVSSPRSRADEILQLQRLTKFGR